MTERGHGPRGFARGRPGGAGIAVRPALDARRSGRATGAEGPRAAPRRAVPRRGEGRRRTGGRRDG